jgi:hypothetical protein
MKAHAPTVILCYPADPADWWFTQGNTRAIAERTLEVHQLMQAWLPQAEAFVLKGTTHGLMIIDPKGMAEGLAGFFARHPLPERP